MAKKKEVINTEVKSKKERLLEKLLEEKKIAEKAEETLKLGFLEDFNEVKRDNYKITGVLGYDLNVGGLKRGAFHVIYGDASTGKTTTILNLLEGIQMTQPDAITLYLDAETTVDERFLSRMPYLNSENIIFLKEQTAEYALDKIVEYAKENLVDYIVIDSVDSLVSKKETEKGLDEAVMMEKARVLSRALPILQSACRENNLTVILIQQLRTKMSGIFVSEGRSGGNAMKFYPSTVVKLSNISSQNETDSNGKISSKYLKIKNEKSKIGNPYAETYSFINTSSDKSSIDRIKECLNYACDLSLIEKKGAWVYIPDENGEIKSFQGIAKAQEEFKKDIDLYSLTKLRIYGKMLDPEIFIIKFDEIIEYLTTENKMMKNKKVDLLKAIGREDLINTKDYEEFNLNEPKPEDYMEEETYKKAKFQMLTIKEKEEYLKEIEEKNKVIEIKEV